MINREDYEHLLEAWRKYVAAVRGCVQCLVQQLEQIRIKLCQACPEEPCSCRDEMAGPDLPKNDFFSRTCEADVAWHATSDTEGHDAKIRRTSDKLKLAAAVARWTPAPVYRLAGDKGEIYDPVETFAQAKDIIVEHGTAYMSILTDNEEIVAGEIIARFEADQSEKPRQFAKFFEDERGAINAVLTGQSSQLFGPNDRSKARRISSLFCLKHERQLMADEFRVDFELGKNPLSGTLGKWAYEIRSRCKDVFGEDAALWNEIVRRKGDKIMLQVEKTPYSELMAVCRKCKRPYEPSEDHLVKCPNCGVSRNRKGYKGRRISMEEAEDRIGNGQRRK